MTAAPNRESGASTMSAPAHGETPRDALLAALNELLEAERAGARGVNRMCGRTVDPACRGTLHSVAIDEARFCAMLDHHIRRLGGQPSRKTGAFHRKLAAVELLPDQLKLLNRGQGWVVRRLRELLPLIRDRELHDDLTKMLFVHRRNIERCTVFEGPPGMAEAVGRNARAGNGGVEQSHG